MWDLILHMVPIASVVAQAAAARHNFMLAQS